MDNHVIFEDRTTETPEHARHRQLAAPASQLVGHSMSLAQGNGAVGLQILAAALAQGTALAGAPIDDVLEFVRQHHAVATAFVEEQRLRAGRHADA